MTRDLSRASGTLRPMPPSPKGPLRPIQILKGMQKLPKRRLKRIVNPRWHATEVGVKRNPTLSIWKTITSHRGAFCLSRSKSWTHTAFTPVVERLCQNALDCNAECKRYGINLICSRCRCGGIFTRRSCFSGWLRLRRLITRFSRGCPISPEAVVMPCSLRQIRRGRAAVA